MGPRRSVRSRSALLDDLAKLDNARKLLQLAATDVFRYLDTMSPHLASALFDNDATALDFSAARLCT